MSPPSSEEDKILSVEKELVLLPVNEEGKILGLE